jgi:hypothetical protein
MSLEKYIRDIFRPKEGIMFKDITLLINAEGEKCLDLWLRQCQIKGSIKVIE